MNDLASHIFDMGNAMNRAKAAEIQAKVADWEKSVKENPPQRVTDFSEPTKGRWDTVQPSLTGDARREVLGEVAPHIAKIPLRAEVRDMLIAADMYQEHADLLTNGAELHEKFAKQNREEAARLEKMARDARESADNLERMANL